jgi:hypothetical protein
MLFFSFFINTFKILYEIVVYQYCLFDYLAFQREYSSSQYYSNDLAAKVHVYSIVLMIKFITQPFFISQKHYRSDSFLEDMKANLKNVAIPGTGIPLSYFVLNRIFLYLFIFIFLPLICFCGAIHQTYQDFVEKTNENQENESIPSMIMMSKPTTKDEKPPQSATAKASRAPSMMNPSSQSSSSASSSSSSSSSSWGSPTVSFSSTDWTLNLYQHFKDNLLTSNNWFNLWRHNSHLVSYHSYLTHSSDYQMEDKWTFLRIGKDLNIPISPYYDDIETIVCKNILIEGGMGIHFYKNAIFGGNYILQEKLKNAIWLNDLLPKNPPLSTMRIITTSTFTLSKDYSEKALIRRLTDEELFNKVAEALDGFPLDGEDSNTTEGGERQRKRGASLASSDDGWRIGGEEREIPLAPLQQRLNDSNHSHYNNINSRNSSTDANDDHHQSQQQQQQPQYSTPRQQKQKQQLYYHQTLGEFEEEEIKKYIRAETAVLRLGRMNAATDHSSVLFNVNLSNGMIEPGQVNSHWYQLGLDKIATTTWLPPVTDVRNHLDPPYPVVAGKIVPDMSEAVKIVTRYRHHLFHCSFTEAFSDLSVSLVRIIK